MMAMIKKLMTIMACAAIVASCAKEQAPTKENDSPDDSQNPPVEDPLPSDGLKDKTFIVKNVSTKTYFDGTLSDAGKVIMKWCADDTIGIWDGVQVRKFHMVSEPIDAAAVFKGRVDENATEFHAVYPYVKDWQPVSPADLQAAEVTVPSVQTVSVDGGVAEGAVLALGKADENDRIAFDIIPALLQYSPTKDEGVASVSVAGSDGLAVTMNVADGGTFMAGKDYYVAVDPDKFDAGYTFTLSAADASVVATETLEGPLGLACAEVYPLMGIPERTYYDIWQAGEDVMIAGKAYNKSQYGEATLVKAGTELTITATKGVFIIEPGADVTYTPSSSITNMIIIGSNLKERSSMVQKIHYKVATDGTIAVMNMDINADALTGSTYLFNIYSTNTPKRFALDNCSMTFANKNFMYHAKDTWVSEVAFHNCDVQFTYNASNDIWLFNVDSKAPSVELFDFQNNVFWHNGTMAQGKAFRITNGENLTIKKLIFRNNTFVNLPTRDTRTSYIGSSVLEGEISSNLIYLPSQPVNGSMLRQTSEGVIFGTNYCYTGGTYAFAPFTAAETDPFTTCDITTGKFVKAEAYADYGAKR